MCGEVFSASIVWKKIYEEFGKMYRNHDKFDIDDVLRFANIYEIMALYLCK
jgi:hypothetical protein